ncbi:Na(+)-translocating NADH-quinone reductase subunit B, partial [Frankliniella fusca]
VHVLRADSSSSSSSDDDDPSPADVMEAAVQECVRKHEPPMIGGGDYAELAKGLVEVVYPSGNVDYGVLYIQFAIDMVSTSKSRLVVWTQITTCVSDGMEALGAGTAPAAVEKQIADCINSKPFPDNLKPTVDSFLACVRGVLL